MASSMDHSLLVFLLFLALSLQIHARESQFFSKTLRFEAPPMVSTSSIVEEPAMVLPPQSHNGYGLYGHDPDQFPSTTSTVTKTNYNTNTNTNNAAYREPDTVPSTFTNAEFSQSYQNKERDYPSSIPSSFNNAEFSTESYENNERNYADNIPSSSFTAAGYSTANKYTPSMFTDEELKRGSYETKVPNYSNYDKQHGMSDTRFVENGKYFYDVSAERNSREYEAMKGNSERYGSYGYKNEEGGYLNNREKKEMQEDDVP